jgi:hypothetical protein
MLRAIRTFAMCLLLTLALHTSEAQEFPQHITESPFVATRIVTSTDVKGEHVTFGTIARRSDGSVYFEMKSVDGKGTVVIYDMRQHRGIQLYPEAHVYTFFSFDLKPQTLPPGYVQSFLSSVEAPGSKRTSGDSEITTIGVREMEGLQTVGYLQTTAQGRSFEHWYSPTLGFNVVSKGYQPADGVKLETHIQQIQLREPDPKLFEIPDGYVHDKRNAAATGAIAR